MTEALKNNLIDIDPANPEMGEEIYKDLIRLCKLELVPSFPLIAYGVHTIPEDVVETLARMPEDEFNTLVDTYQKEVYITPTKVNEETAPKIRQAIVKSAPAKCHD